MTAGEWLVEALAWAALETWFQRNPLGPVNRDAPGAFPTVDEALHNFMACLPPDLWYATRAEWYRRRFAQEELGAP